MSEINVQYCPTIFCQIYLKDILYLADVIRKVYILSLADIILILHSGNLFF